MIVSKNIEIDEHGLNIIRNGIKTEHIDYSQIEKAEIKQEFYQRNWIIGLLIGIIIIIVTFLWLFDSLRSFEYETPPTRLIRAGWMLFISQFVVFIFGIGIIFSSLKRSLIIYFWVTGKVKRIQLLDIEKQKKVNELFDFLGERIKIEKLHVL
ncbi:MAG TPA: hypothetical protein DCG75_01745 [Bacteroidales bacterium]|nr:hypothetical protein [Bacteroidales bacterium]